MLLIVWLAVFGRKANSGPTFTVTGFEGTPWKFTGTVENTSPQTMRNVVAICEVIEGSKVLEQYSFQHKTLEPGIKWDVEAPIRNHYLLAIVRNTDFTYRTRITAERSRIGPIVFIYRRKSQY